MKAREPEINPHQLHKKRHGFAMEKGRSPKLSGQPRQLNQQALVPERDLVSKQEVTGI